MSTALKLSYDAVVCACCECSMEFSFPRAFYEMKKADSGDFYCPHGHQQHYSKGKSREDLLKEQLYKATREIEFHKNHRQHIEKELIAKKGQLTKLKNRVSKGVCPCCNRQFANLHRHMACKHPEFK